MLSRFFGKHDKSEDPPTKEVKKARGLVVTEDDPEAAWKKWDKALAAQDSGLSKRPVPPAPAPAPVRTPSAAQPAPSPMRTFTALAVKSAPAPELDFVLPTVPMPLEQMTLEQRKKIALDTVDLHHHRIANTIRTLWGYKECSVYINKLIMAGGDGMGHARVGFNQEAVEAMLALSDIHDAEFGPPDSIVGGLGLKI
jgi:hypothetical protein